MAVLALTTTLVLGARWGDPLGVALLILAGVLAATGVTAFIVSFARTPEQAGYWQSIVGVVLGLLGGSFFPVYQAGGVAEQLSNLTPHAWFLRGLGDLTAGGTVSDVLRPAGVILGMAALTGGLAVLRLGRTLRP
jgi:ABC-2 type transport system permease protein